MKKKFDYQILIILVLASIIILFPIFWIISTSFKNQSQSFQIPPVWFFIPRIDSYKQTIGSSGTIVSTGNFLPFLLNSLIVTIATTIISLILGLPAAYALTRFNFRYRDNISFWFLSLKMMPPIAAVIPIFYLASKLKLLGSYFVIVLVYLIFSLPYVIWMMRGFFKDIPISLEEAARVDGANRIQTFLKISLPLSLPAISATAILTWIFAWNEFLFAFILSNKDTRTIPVAIAGLWTMYNIYWNNIAAAGVIAFLPVLIFSFFVQRFIVRGMTLGSVKY